MGILSIKKPGTGVLYSFAFCFIVFFYPIIALLNSVIGINSNILSIIYRGIALALSLYLIFINIEIKDTFTFNKYILLLIIFWCYYLIKLLIDLYIINLVPNLEIFSYSKSYYILMSFGVCFLPMLASYKISGKINQESLNKYLLFTFALINILLTVSFISKYGMDVAKYATTRISIRSESGNPPLLNPITIGTYGVFLLITLMYVKLNSLIKIPLFIIAFTNLILSASLGPFFGLIIMVITYLCFKWRTINKILISAIALILAGILFVVFSGIDERFFLFNRLMNLDSNQSTFIRIESIKLAFDQIKSNLIFGTHFFVTKNSSSPHNIFIDIFLSTGLLGIGLILFPVFHFFKHFIKDNGNTLILQIALYTFILAQTSGYVFGLSDFWPTFAFSLGIISINTNNQAIRI